MQGRGPKAIKVGRRDRVATSQTPKMAIVDGGGPRRAALSTLGRAERLARVAKIGWAPRIAESGRMTPT